MKKVILAVLALSFVSVANAGVVRYAAKHAYKASKSAGKGSVHAAQKGARGFGKAAKGVGKAAF